MCIYIYIYIYIHIYKQLIQKEKGSFFLKNEIETFLHAVK